MGTLSPYKLRFRKSFAKIPTIMDVPNLIEIQQGSYEKFLQADVVPDKREETGLQGVFKSVFPIKNYNETSSLEFISYTLGSPKYDIQECRQKELTYAAPLKVLTRLVVWDVNHETGTKISGT